MHRKARTFLNFATSLSESMDMDHIATRAFAHWVGGGSPWYEELRRVTQFTNSLGRFVTVDEYFNDTYDPGIHDRFKADQYHSPWLQQQAEAQCPRPISAWVDYWQHYLQLQTWLNCSTLALFVQDDDASREQYTRANDCLDRFSRQPLDDGWKHELHEARQQMNDAAAGWVRAVYGSQATTSADSPTGCALVNPWSFPRRIGFTNSPVMPATEPPIYAAESTGQGHDIVADVPAMGLTRVNSSASRARFGKKTPPPLATDQVLRNEFLEAHFDPSTGSLVTIRDYRDRTNRLSQQLAFRMPGSLDAGRSAPAIYSRMIGDALEVQHANSIQGRIQTRGRLVDEEGQTLAEFVQTFELWRGSRVLKIHIDLQPHRAPGPDAWDSYFACRFAWSNEAAEVSRALNDVRCTCTGKRFEAPLFVHLDDGSASTTVLTGGLPFHRRIGRRMLDTLLITGHEQQRQFRLGVGLDLKQPFREAIAFLAPELVVPLTSATDHANSMWLFHADARHVLCTAWHPVWEHDRVAGLRVRLIELEGRRGRVNLQSFRPLRSARKIDGLGQTVEICDVDDLRMSVNVSPHEQVDLEALFA